MDAEGSEDDVMTDEEIRHFLKCLGYYARNISVDYDNIMSLWRWTADIEKIYC